MIQEGLIPLLLHMEGCATKEEMNANVAATIERGYVRFNEYLGRFSGEIAVVGSAPSLERTYKDLKGDVMAINHSLKFLLEKDVVPKFAMFWDASQLVSEFAIPHPDITYLVGARCHPTVFEKLKDCKTIVWHAGGDHNIMEYLFEHKIDEPMINGGSAGVTRALYLGFALGYRNFGIYGADSSYSEDGRTHVNGSLVPEKDFMISAGSENPIWFRTTPEMCGQIEEYKLIYPLFNQLGCKVDVYGDGLLSHIHKKLVGLAANSTT